MVKMNFVVLRVKGSRFIPYIHYPNYLICLVCKNFPVNRILRLSACEKEKALYFCGKIGGCCGHDDGEDRFDEGDDWWHDRED